MEFVHIELKRDTWIGGQITDPETAIEKVGSIVENIDREMVISLNLATDGTIINASICAIGTLNQSFVSISNILRTAIVSGAASLILIHNHPSGNTDISKEDLSITRKLAVACQLMDLRLLDHIVIGSGKQYLSIYETHEECFEFMKLA